jgi:hypothetical protein
LIMEEEIEGEERRGEERRGEERRGEERRGEEKRKEERRREKKRGEERRGEEKRREERQGDGLSRGEEKLSVQHFILNPSPYPPSQARTYLFCAIRPEVQFLKYTFATLGFAKNASVVKLAPKKVYCVISIRRWVSDALSVWID